MFLNILGNSSHPVSWAPNPTFRGTSNILQSCLITTSLCVWTAVHLNIKEHDNPAFLRISYQTWRKLGFLVLGLLAPEMLVYTAWYQRTEAKKFAQIYNEHFGLIQSPGLFDRGGKYHRMFQELLLCKKTVKGEEAVAQISNLPQRRPWTFAHGFYAYMGGFALVAPGSYPGIFPEDQMMLNLQCFRFVLLHGTQSQPEDLARGPDGCEEPSSGQFHSSLCRMLDISEDAVKERSKADGLAKALVCLQALWFIIQCFIRLSQKLSITLLELNTLAHSICALLVYIFWWHKPLDVGQTESLPISDATGIHIWACLNQSNLYKYQDQSSQFSISKGLEYVRNRLYGPPWQMFDVPGTLKPRAETRPGVTSDISDLGWDFVCASGETIQGFLVPIPDELALSEDDEFILSEYENEQYGIWWPRPGHSIPNRLPRFETAKCVPGDKTISTAPNEWTLQLYRYPKTNRASRRAHNWPIFDISRAWVQFIFLLVAFLYGGVHVLAWNSVFPSTAQQLLWRISAAMIMGAGLPALILYFSLQTVDFGIDPGEGELEDRLIRARRWRYYVYRASRPLLKRRLACILDIGRDYFDEEVQDGPRNYAVWPAAPRLYKFMDGIMNSTLIMVLLAYVCGRVYLVVESFIQLFHLQPGTVFAQPIWSTYFPHLG